MRKLLVFLFITIVVSCTQDNNTIDGWYYVGDNVKDLVHIMRRNDTLHISSNGWSEFAILQNDNFSGTWRYTDGTKGFHKGKILGDEIQVQIESNHRNPVGNVTWHKAKSMEEVSYVYLTFDDGPLNGTKEVINILEREKVQGTFFVVGLHIEHNRKNQLTFEELLESDNVVANHSYSHASSQYKKFYSNASIVKKDLYDNAKLLNQYKHIISADNIQSDIIRFPGRNAWNINGLKSDNQDALSALKLLPKSQKVIGWDTEWHSTINEQPFTIFQRISNKTILQKTRKESHCVLLTHDVMFQDKQSCLQLEILIAMLRDAGFEFRTLDEY